jgi:hypothetical protein
MQTKKRGRPAKNGVKDVRALSRVFAVLYSYDNARSRGEKYSLAIRECVAFVRQLHPGMPISETEVKRILAEFRPRNGRVILKVECSVAEGEEAQAIRSKLLSFRGFMPGSHTESAQKGSKPLKRFILRFATALEYPRHNARDSEQPSR